MESMPSPAPMSGAAGSTVSGRHVEAKGFDELAREFGDQGIGLCSHVGSYRVGGWALRMSSASRQSVEDQAGVGAAEAEGALEHVFLIGERPRGWSRRRGGCRDRA